MVETIKAEISDELARKFRKKAMERHGYRKGAIKNALEDMIRKYVASGNADWSRLRGCIKSKETSVELQHKALKRSD